ncbi:MAG: hypothetical protein OXE99_06810 [Cellvibrionales bacterium]|nr:hypothetical protein [Cellvibrionales bacterium]
MLYTSSKPISKDRAVAIALGSAPIYAPILQLLKPQTDMAFVGWGNKPSTHKTRAWANKNNLRFSQLEDGFISFAGHPALAGSSRLSLIHDKTGIYYDARKPCDLDLLLNETALNNEQMQRIESIIQAITDVGITKYNHLPASFKGSCLESNAVLIIDQTQGDASIEGALATEADFICMVETAKKNHPNAPIYLKVHPDILLGKKQGVLHSRLNKLDGIKLLPTKLTTHDCLTHFKTLYTVCSQMGFEALWYGCKVYCFGMPFYAGRGLTIDTKPAPAFRQPVSLPTLSYAALIDYCHYVHPETHQLTEIEDILSLLIALKKHQAVTQHNTLYALDFSFWKRKFLPQWLKFYAKDIIFTKAEKAIENATTEDAFVIWGSKSPSIKHKTCIRIEDGFIRSKGLGIDLTPPLSLVFDPVGIYFDATRPSHLENLLFSTPVDKTKKSRAANLRKKIRKHRISKYNLNETGSLPQLPTDKKIILIPGQVDNDASIRLGDLSEIGILGVLKKARKTNPNAFIIYRPHPDVLTGERTGVTAKQATPFADHIDCHTPIHSTLSAADEVHVLTSLVGFEALLQEKTVICYGMPFYAGWGLTQDKISCERRGVKRTLDELVYLTLIDYAIYLHPNTLMPTTVENAIDWLADQSQDVATGIGYAGRLQKKIRHLLS